MPPGVMKTPGLREASAPSREGDPFDDMKEDKMKAYKGFGKDMKCRGYQFEEEMAYETERAKLCKEGFHACEMPLDTMTYYYPTESEYHEVDLDGITGEKSDDSKVCGTKIKIGARLSIKDLVKAEIEIIRKKVKATTGDGAHAATTGYRAHAATTGDCAHAATTGNCAHAEAKGKNSIAVAVGRESVAKASIGNWLVLAEYDANDNYELVCVQTVRIDGETYKPDVWYKLEAGKVVEAVENDEND